jgi:phosphoserine phosphatase
MKSHPWQPSSPIQAISFDCDGTLSTIEGIDHLAKLNSQFDRVRKLTQQAMEETGLSLSLYNERLDIVQPTQQQLHQLSDMYFNHLTDGAQQVIALFQKLNKAIFIISAGNNPAVSLLGERLHIPQEHCFAVDLYFDSNGKYQGLDQDSPLINRYGKNDILENIKEEHGSVLHIGDGMNDLEAKDVPTRFIGYGGNFQNSNVAQQAPFYFNAPTLLPLIPLSLTEEETEQLEPEDLELYKLGVKLLECHFKTNP